MYEPALTVAREAHRDLQADGRATFVVAQAGFDDMSQARCTVTGTFTGVEDADEVAAAREAYLKVHSEAFWIDFGDFSYLRMDDVVAANLIAGFGRAHKVRQPLLHLSLIHI